MQNPDSVDLKALLVHIGASLDYALNLLFSIHVRSCQKLLSC
jgi:hypothetical protein